MTRRALLWMVFTFAFPLTTLAAEPGHDAHATAAHPAIELNAGQKWQTDMPLRKGMSAIRDQVVAVLPAAHDGTLTVAQYDVLGKSINLNIADIVRNCKLEPKADAQLHGVLGELGAGVEALDGQQGDAQRAAGVVKVAQALNLYGKYFDHPGWKAIALPR